MKTSALVLIVALAGLDPLSTTAVLAASQTGTPDVTYRNACSIPNVIGLLHDQAIQRLRSADYRVSIETRPSRSPRGEVIDQQPRRCADLSDGRNIVLVVSAGSSESGTYDGEPQTPAEPRRPRPNGGSSVGTAVAIGAAAAIGIAILASRNKDKSTEEKEKSEPRPDPPRTVARSAVVPAVVGMSSDDALRTIAAAKLQMRTTNEAEAAVAGSTVAGQTPAAGTPVVPGASVAVTFEAPPPPAPQPAPVAAPAPAPIVTMAPPSPPPTPQTMHVPRVPVAVPTVVAVIPSSSIPGLVDGPRRVVPLGPGVDVAPDVPWLWILLVALFIVELATYYRARDRHARSPGTPPHAEPPPAPGLTVIPNLDPGEQRIVSGGGSRSLDLSFNLDGGLQQITCLGSHVRIGAVS